MSYTIKCHYIPCFWSAFWNLNYHNNEFYRNKQSARNQEVYSLNLRSNNLFVTKVKNVFFEKKMNLSDVDNSSMIGFIRRNMPNEETKFYENIIDDDSSSILDFEDFYTIIDKSLIKPISKIILSKNIINITDKAEISYLMATLIIRNFNYFNTLTKLYKDLNLPKFELYWELRQSLSDPDFNMKLIYPLISSKWILYKLASPVIPLCDQPILESESDIYFTLSPYLLLKIEYNSKVSPNHICEVKDGIDESVYNQLTKRILDFGKREIISPNKEILTKIKRSGEFKNKYRKQIK